MTALAVCPETGILGHLGEPAAVPELAAAAGVEEGLAKSLFGRRGSNGTHPPFGGSVLRRRRVGQCPARPGCPRSAQFGLLQQADLIRAARDGALMTGWRHNDPHILEAQGVMSAGLVRTIEQYAFGHMEGLSEMLGQPGATFLTWARAWLRR
jgi:hypothetical protein